MDNCCIGNDNSVMCEGDKVKRNTAPGFFGTTSKGGEYWVQAVHLKENGGDKMDISLGKNGFSPIRNKTCSKFVRAGGGRGYKKRKIKKKKNKRTKKIKTRKYKKSKRKRN